MVLVHVGLGAGGVPAGISSFRGGAFRGGLVGAGSCRPDRARGGRRRRRGAGGAQPLGGVTGSWAALGSVRALWGREQ
eukprot:15444101-Alexandrium_andersonii.AAC.1